jgi:pimeloyl-ACP methyl ester carboxylesterase
MTQGTITTADGRTIGFADYGSPDQVAVLWCHGAPSSRLEPKPFAPAFARAGLRIISIDRPGYGRSTAQPGRTIGGWAADALAVVDHLRIDRFAVVGLSTGGSHALAVAAASRQVMAAVACCAVSDMRWSEGKALMPTALPVWMAPSRDAALAIVTEAFGEKGEKTNPETSDDTLAESDRAMLADPAYRTWWPDSMPETFAQGVVGYVDDRLADGQGWGSFDVAAITCPVAVIHGTSDRLVPVAHARHTAAIVPGAVLETFDGLGHFSIAREVVNSVTPLIRGGRPAVRS